MWQHRSNILTSFSSVTSKQAKWNWSKECQKKIHKVKKLVKKLCLPILTAMNHLKFIHTQENYKTTTEISN